MLVGEEVRRRKAEYDMALGLTVCGGLLGAVVVTFAALVLKAAEHGVFNGPL